ncbi:dickkopf-related protein 3-like [Dermochelys coriacea]|uniref:dickkopf-related protein 3-like n=1 Tax=Dermochelys coriacea TaxID=27794 RepID=UPI001CA85128|nr:dickkopf-related protein 3-like [Dermochelys coriacea]
MYSMPYHAPDEATLSKSSSPLADSKEITEATGTCLSHLTLHHLSPQAASTCGQDRHCAHGLFCDKHFRLCLPLRREGQYCRRDTHCARSLSCMFGKCHRPVLDGQEGARCRQDKDCGMATCCTRHHGELLCKKRLALDESCFVPQGGLAFSINQVCPCQEGLVCRTGAAGREKAFEYWQDKSNWRCMKPLL